MEIIIEQNIKDIRPLSTEFLLEMLRPNSRRQNLNINSTLALNEILENPTARNVMTAFIPTHANMRDEQCDASNLKAILNNCNLFSGWVDHDTSDGWLQMFQVVSKMRNDIIGHNNAHRLRTA